MTKVLVCGSRGWHDPNPIYAVLRGLSENGPLTVVHGDAPGADRLAGSIARRLGATEVAIPAEWDVHGRAAGPIRNQRMLDQEKPDVVYAFRTYGKSRGTDHMVAIARKAGVQTYVVSGQEEQDETLPLETELSYE